MGSVSVYRRENGSGLKQLDFNQFESNKEN